jgi:uncharacterized protein YheU (UPF0270 family)
MRDQLLRTAQKVSDQFRSMSKALREQAHSDPLHPETIDRLVRSMTLLEAADIVDREFNLHGTDEGDRCGRDGCVGVIRMSLAENCSCHISPPCQACLSTYLYCPACGWQEESNA